MVGRDWCHLAGTGTDTAMLNPCIHLCAALLMRESTLWACVVTRSRFDPCVIVRKTGLVCCPAPTLVVKCGLAWQAHLGSPWHCLSYPFSCLLISCFLLKALCKQVDHHNYFFALGTSFATWHTQTWYFQYRYLGNLSLALLEHCWPCKAPLPKIPPATAFAVWPLLTQIPLNPSCEIQLSLMVLSHFYVPQPPASEIVSHFPCPAQPLPSTHAQACHLPSVGSLLPITAPGWGIRSSLATAQAGLDCLPSSHRLNACVGFWIFLISIWVV